MAKEVQVMFRFVATWIVVLGAIVFTQPVSAQTPDLSWKMAFLKYTKGKMESLPFARPLSLADGDQFQLLVSPGAAAYVDILYEDTTGVITVLFQGPAKAGQVILLPAEKQNFEVSPPKGTEKLHVIVSLKPQTTFEASLKGLPGTSSKVLDALAALKSSLSSLAEAAEKPAPMGGVTRGLPDVTISEFKGAGTYVKTIRFDH